MHDTTRTTMTMRPTPLRSALMRDGATVLAIALERCRPLMMDDYDDDEVPTRPEKDSVLKKLAPGVAEIPITGLLLNREMAGTFWESGGYITTMATTQKRIQAVIADASIKDVILDVNTYGGSVYGAFETAAMIRELSDVHKRRVTAYVNANCFSGGVLLASGAQKIYATPTAEVGSCGVISYHFDYTSYCEKQGIRVTVIRTSPKKAAGNPYEPLTEETQTEMLDDLQRYHDMFVQTMADHRGVSKAEAQKAWFSGDIWSAKEGKANGLIDGIKTPAEFSADVSARAQATRKAASEARRRAVVLAHSR